MQHYKYLVTTITVAPDVPLMPIKVFQANGFNAEIYIKVLKLSEVMGVIKNDMSENTTLKPICSFDHNLVNNYFFASTTAEAVPLLCCVM